MLVIAHISHWYESVLYALPMLIIGGVLWYTARKERARGPVTDEHWDDDEGSDWNDPRLDD